MTGVFFARLCLGGTPRTFFEKKVLGIPKDFNVMEDQKAIAFRKLFEDS